MKTPTVQDRGLGSDRRRVGMEMGRPVTLEKRWKEGRAWAGE